MTTVIGILLLVAALGLGLFSARALRTDPRRFGNAALVGATALLAAVGITLMGNGAIATLMIVAMVLSPLLMLVLVGFLLWNGVTMVRKEGRSLGNLLSLLTGLAIIAAVLAAWWLAFMADGALWFSVAMWIVMAGGWVGALFCGFLGYSWLYQRTLRRARPDFIVTLGSGLIGDRVPPLLAGRIDRALGIYQGELAAGCRPVLVMSGGQGSDEATSEAEAMGRYACERGIDPADLVLENTSTTTEQNLRNTMVLVRADPRLGAGARGLAVTSDYHALRAAGLASRLGVPVDVVGARTARYFYPSAVLREFVAVLRGSLGRQLTAFALATLPLPVLFAAAAFS